LREKKQLVDGELANGVGEGTFVNTTEVMLVELIPCGKVDESGRERSLVEAAQAKVANES